MSAAVREGTNLRALRNLMIGVLLCVGLLFGVWAIAMHRAIVEQFNYRLSVTFNENGHALTRSSVIHVTARRAFFAILPDSERVRYYIRGEGIPVRFSNGVLIFVLIGVADPRPRPSFTYEAFPAYWYGRKISALPHRTYQVPEKFRPTMIHFGNIEDPKTVELVKPADLSRVVGEVVSLKSITVELTDAPVTWGVEKLIPWATNTSRVRDGSSPALVIRGVSEGYPYYLYRNDW